MYIVPYSISYLSNLDVFFWWLTCLTQHILSRTFIILFESKLYFHGPSNNHHWNTTAQHSLAACCSSRPNRQSIRKFATLTISPMPANWDGGAHYVWGSGIHCILRVSEGENGGTGGGEEGAHCVLFLHAVWVRLTLHSVWRNGFRCRLSRLNKLL